MIKKREFGSLKELDFLILKFLKEKNNSGYGIYKQIKKISSGLLTIENGTTSFSLKKLLANKYISIDKIETDVVKKITYKILPAGIKILNRFYKYCFLDDFFILQLQYNFLFFDNIAILSKSELEEVILIIKEKIEDIKTSEIDKNIKKYLQMNIESKLKFFEIIYKK